MPTRDLLMPCCLLSRILLEVLEKRRQAKPFRLGHVCHRLPEPPPFCPQMLPLDLRHGEPELSE